jgi:hypothetical protein
LSCDQKGTRHENQSSCDSPWRRNHRYWLIPPAGQDFGGEEGFLTVTGLFVDRKQAAEIALNAGQAIEVSNPSLGLSSSDLENNYPISGQS